MTRDDAIKIFNTVLFCGKCDAPKEEIEECLKIAIEALEQKPYEKFKSTKDHICKLASDYKCWDNRLTQDEALELCHILEQEPCEDTISRQKAIRLVKTECNPYGKPTIDFESGKEVIKLLKQMLPVTPKPETVTEFADRCKECGARYGKMLTEKTAHWIRWYEEIEHDKYVEHIPRCKCSECGKVYDTHLSLSINYCSNCGRKMVEKERSDKE